MIFDSSTIRFMRPNLRGRLLADGQTRILSELFQIAQDRIQNNGNVSDPKLGA